MIPDEIVDQLLSIGVLKPKNENKLSIPETFWDDVADFEKDMEGMRKSDFVNEISVMGSGNIQLEHLWSLRNKHTHCISIMLALSAHIKCVDIRNLCQLSIIVEWFERTNPRDEGVPEGFFPVHGDRIQTMVDLFSVGMVYIWRDDCPPCDAVKKMLEQISGCSQGTMTQIAVYGPNYPILLKDDFDVEGGPTILLFANSQIDSRFYGIPFRDILLNEINNAKDKIRIVDDEICDREEV